MAFSALESSIGAILLIHEKFPFNEDFITSYWCFAIRARYFFLSSLRGSINKIDNSSSILQRNHNGKPGECKEEAGT